MSQEARKSIAKKVKELRKLAGLNKEQLSLALNLDNSYISKLENEKINITIDRLEQISFFFNVKIKTFFN